MNKPKFKVGQIVWFNFGDSTGDIEITKGKITKIYADDDPVFYHAQVICKGKKSYNYYMWEGDMYTTRKALVQSYIKGEKAYLRHRREYLKGLEQQYRV